MNWYNNDPFNHSAALSFYTIFSFPALILIYLTIASIFSTEQNLHQQMMAYLQNIVGESGVKNIEEIIINSSPDYTNIKAAIVGLTVLLFAGLSLFLQLQKSLNNIWQVAPVNFTIKGLIKKRIVSLGVMLSIGFVLLVSLIGNIILNFIGDWIIAHISEELLIVIHIINISFSFFIISLLFTVLLKFLPDIFIPFKFALIGGITSAFMFTIGQYLIGIYFDIAKPDSAYGVTGSIILLMLWVSYSCVIILYGAEITKVVMEDNMKE